MRRFRFPPLLLVLITTATGALLIGCEANPVPAPVDTRGGANYAKINLLEGLDDVVADTPVVTVGQGVPMAVQVPLRSTTHSDLSVQYRFAFYDAMRRELPDLGWQRLDLPSSAQRMATGSALDTNAVDWRLEIRAAR